MKQILQHTLVLCGSLLALAGCSTEELATAPISGKPTTLVATIGSNTNTRTGHEEGDPSGVKVRWIADDVINIYSGELSADNTPFAFVCESIDAEGDGTFGSEQTPVGGDSYFALYPATLSYDFKLSMLGQKQARDGDMAHLGAYDAMYTETNDWKTVDFSASSPESSAHLASLITFDLQNLPTTLGIPTKITLGCIDGSGNAAAVFKETLNDNNSMVSTLSLALGDGFADITDENNSIKAYLMVAPATIPVGSKLTIAVECSDNTYQFTSKAVGTEIKYVAGKRHTAAVAGEVSWETPFTSSTYTGAEAEEAFAGGGSSAEDPYLIGTAGQLRTLIETTNDGSQGGYSGKFFKLTTDICIAMKDDGVWTPIGINFKNFQGNFDGNGRTISGSMTGTVSGFGFFGYTSGATITNLTVDATVSGGRCVGGIVGEAASTSISNCTNKGAVTGTNTSTGAKAYVGGIVGYISTSSIIIGCVNEGTVLGEKSNYVGGIVGGFISRDSRESSSLIACYNTAAVTTFANNGGGIAGALKNGITTACYNTGKIAQADNGTTYIGTIIGGVDVSYGVISTVSYCQWVLDTESTELPAFPGNASDTSTDNTKRDNLAALNAAGVTALNTGITAWNTANAATPAKHCAFHFVAGTASTGPTLAAGAPK